MNGANPHARLLSLTVNGRQIDAPTTPCTHLTDFPGAGQLFAGTHRGCEQGVCGGRTVLVDDESIGDCRTYPLGCDGRSVTTVERLNDDQIVAPFWVAFSAEHALQCGSCTPGMWISAQDLVRRLPDADNSRIRVEMSGNLCRCIG